MEEHKFYLLFAMYVSPRQTHSRFRRQVFPGRLKSHAVHTSSETIDGGWKCGKYIIQMNKRNARY